MFHIVQPPFLLWICSLSNHLFSLSEVLCIRSAAKVKDKSDNCDESYQEVPKSRGHRQVFCSPTEKLEHIGFFPHSGDICKLTKQCLMAGLILSRLSRLTENSRFRLFHVGSKKSSVRLNSHGGLLPDRRFPYLTKDDGMTWWLPRYLPPPPRHKCHGLARASKKACRGQRWFGHVCISFTVSSRSAFSIYLRETNTVHFTSIEILGRPVCKGIVPLENFFCLNASYFRQ